MEYNNSKDKDVVIEIDRPETSNEAAETINDSLPNPKRAKKKTLSKLVSGVLGRKSLPVNESMELLIDRNNARKQTCELVPLVVKGNDYKAERPKRSPKPPRPPRGPSLDAADMRMVREIAKITAQKRERMERIKAVKKMKAEKASALSSPSQSSSSSKSSGGTISAMVITILFFLVIFYQGLGSINSSSLALAGAGAPQPAPDTKSGIISIQSQETALSDNGAAPNSASPEYMESFMRYHGK